MRTFEDFNSQANLRAFEGTEGGIPYTQIDISVGTKITNNATWRDALRLIIHDHIVDEMMFELPRNAPMHEGRLYVRELQLKHPLCVVEPGKILAESK